MANGIVKYWFVLILFLAGNEVCGQSIEGSIIDAATGEPLEFATVAVTDQGNKLINSGTTDPKGAFKIAALSEGEWTVKIQYIGFKDTVFHHVLLGKNEKKNLGTIGLLSDAQVLRDVVAKGEKSAAIHKIDKQVFNASQFQNATGGNATDVLKNLPSVSVNSEGDITFRGSSHFVVLIDGKPVQSDAAVVLNQLPANAIENIELITTPSSKYDAEGKSGIVNITTKKGSTDGLYLLVNAQFGLPSVKDYGNEKRPRRAGGDFTANYKIKKWNVSLGANYKRDDIAGYRTGEAETYLNGIKTTYPSVGERSYEVYSWSVRGTANYNISPATTLEAGFYGGKKSQYRTANLIYNQRRYDEGTGVILHSFDYFNKNFRERKGDFAIANVGLNHTFKNKATLAFSLLYERTILGGPTKNTDVGVAPEKEGIVYTNAYMDEKNPLDGSRIKIDYTLPVTTKGKLETGYQFRSLLHHGEFIYNENNLSDNTWHVLPQFSNKVKLTRNIHSIYSQFSNEAGKLNYSAGLRLELTDRKLVDDGTPAPYTFKRLNLFPSFNLLYPFGNHYKLKSGYSRRIVHTTSNMMNPFYARRHSEVFEIGDPNLIPEYIDLAEIGIIKEFGSNTIAGTVYYQRTENVINRVNGVFNDTILIRTYTNAGNASSYGVELGLDLKPFKWWSIFTGGNLFAYTLKGNVFSQEVNRNSINYLLKVNSTFKLSPTWNVQFNLNYTSRTITAQGEDSEFIIPSATVKKSFSDGRASISLQWTNIDLGLWKANEQEITTRGKNFYTSTNYIQEVDIFRINLSYQLTKLNRKVKFTESEFGEKEF